MKGTLKAVGLRADRPVAQSVLATAGNATALRLVADRNVVQADGQDLSFVTVEAVDAQGRWQPLADQEVQFSLSGPGKIIAVGNGDGHDDAAYQGDLRKLFEGRALVVIRTSRQSGPIKLKAIMSGLEGSVSIEAKSAQPRSELQ